MSVLNSLFIISGCLTAVYTPAGVAGFTALITLGSFLRFLAYFSLAGKDVSKSVFFLLPIVVLETAPSLFFLEMKTYGLALTGSYLIGCFATSMLVLILNKYFLIRGVPIWSYLSSTLAVLLDGRGEWLEKISEKLDEVAEIQIDILCFKDLGASRPKLAVIIPTFHPGPFRNFGSSQLIYEISDALKSEDVEAIFLKGLSNHERNIVSKEDCEKIIKGIVDALEDLRDNEYKSSVSSPMEIGSNDVSGLLISVGGSKLVFLTRHPKGMEDIPPSILERVNDDSLIPVDSHNSFSDDVKDLDDDALEEFIKVLEKASSHSPAEKSPLLLGYSRSFVGNFSREDGMGDLGASVLVLGHNDALTAIISLDGNNCLPEVRSAIIQELKSLKFAAIEVVTTDTHVVNGLRFGGRGYHPLGEVIPATLLAEKVLEAAEKAVKDIYPAEVARIKLRFKNVKVTSASFMEEVAAKAYRGLLLFPLFIAASIVFGLFWSLFLL